MNKQTQELAERRSGTREMCEKLLIERKDMLALYWQVAGLEPFSSDKPVNQYLQDFCQVLVDYIAFGHFEVYDRITSGKERRAKVIEVAEKIYPRIAEATDVAVNFNDKYDASDHELSLDDFSRDLSKLGEEIATRVEMEDRLLAVMLMR